MQWVTVGRTAINTENVDAFKWADGTLYVFFNAEKEATEWEDPDAQLYRKLCRDVYVMPVVVRD